MSKAARLRRKQAKARKAKTALRKRGPRSTPSRIGAALKAAWSGLSNAWKVFVAIVVLLAAGAQVYFSTWRMSVSPGETLKASDPFTTIFVLHNEGQFPMYDIRFGCLVNAVNYPNDFTVKETLIYAPSLVVNRLDANARTSTLCDLGVQAGDPQKVDLTVLISYRPSFFPFSRSANFRFVAIPNDRGGFSWTPMGE